MFRRSRPAETFLLLGKEPDLWSPAIWLHPHLLLQNLLAASQPMGSLPCLHPEAQLCCVIWALLVQLGHVSFAYQICKWGHQNLKSPQWQVTGEVLCFFPAWASWQPHWPPRKPGCVHSKSLGDEEEKKFTGALPGLVHGKCWRLSSRSPAVLELGGEGSDYGFFFVFLIHELQIFQRTSLYLRR